MTDIEALRARMRELATAAKAAPDPPKGFSSNDDEYFRWQCIHSDFEVACTPDAILALDAEITRLREEMEKVADVVEPHWRGAGVCLSAEWLIGEWLGKCRQIEAADDRAEAAEAALAKRDEEVARLWDKVEGLSADLTEAVRIAYKYGAATWVQMNYPKQHATLSKEPTNAE